MDKENAHIHTTHVERKAIPTHAVTQMSPEETVLSQAQKDTYSTIPLMRCPEQSNSPRQEVEWRLWEPGEGGRSGGGGVV